MSGSATASAFAPGRLLRFGAVGGANTLVTSAAFYLLALELPATAAFTLVFAGGLTFVTAMTPGYVFGTSPSAGRRAALAGWYAATWLAGVGTIALLEGALDAPRAAVVLGTVAVTAPLNFLGGLLLVGRA
jgi:putative flippase GtrA